ncbi:MAG: DUF3137 domain-containing protein [Sphingomonadales bacterium]
MAELSAEHELAVRSSRRRWWWPALELGSALALWLLAGPLGLLIVLVVTAPLHRPMMNYLRRPMLGFERSGKRRVFEAICRNYGFDYVETPDASRISAVGQPLVLPEHDLAGAEDLISGTYNGVDLQWAEVRLHRDILGTSELVFEGKVIRLSLARPSSRPAIIWPLRVIEDQGGAPLPDHDRVDLEDLDFAQVYQLFIADGGGAADLLDDASRRALLELAEDFPSGTFTFMEDSLYVADFQLVPRMGRKQPNAMQRLAQIADELAILFRILDIFRLSLVPKRASTLQA